MPSPLQSSPHLPAPQQYPTGQSSTDPTAGLGVKILSPRHVLFLLLILLSVPVFWNSLAATVHYSLSRDNQFDKYSYIFAIPFISIALVLFDKRRIFRVVRYSPPAGVVLLLAGVALNGFAGHILPQIGTNDLLSVRILGLVLFWLSAFILCYGTQAFRAGLFPLGFLMLAVPIPDSILEKPVTAVQYGSTEVCSLVFTVVGVPVLRNGTVFSLAHNTIEVAKECSGIHSTFAILIISLVAGHLFLSSVWKKSVLVLLALPIVCVTNGFRIAGLTLLAEYVNASFLHGSLHRRGGLGFFLLALLMLFGILQLLRRAEFSAQ